MLTADSRIQHSRAEQLERSNPARPYMVRFSILRRLICPLTGLAVQGVTNAALIASKLRRRLAANRANKAAISTRLRVVAELEAAKMGAPVHLIERNAHETLTYYSFPDIHWQKIRTNNPLERIMKEICRQPGVVGAFPDGQSSSTWPQPG